MQYNEHYARRDDQSTSCFLELIKIGTGEIFLKIYDGETREEMLVGFTNFVGGGRSPETLKALEVLALAIEKDNQKYPLTLWHDEITPERIGKNR
jgi:hypothetical protein